ncbi:PHD and RING finger domain-containing protein 1-like [Sitophilus oryzae]|uniref:PHD and RING finger domain-containing protein 1-like n=1 Tax=Sitophilus oryzae TaxID=7048 RepID=A0A6J2YLN9_SITOR|nr:PHD and RING finger domain-containing protein 1-like [Sitophilus oryzae]
MDEPNRKRKSNEDRNESDKKRGKVDLEVSKTSETSANLTTSSNETCPICLSSVHKRLLGIPKNCRHRFCLYCIRKWSRKKNTCPVCRKKYSSIIVRSRYTRRRVRQLPISKKAGATEDSRYTAFVEMISRALVNLVGNLFVATH